MIDFYYYTSPNARKVLIMLEETGLPYRVVWVDIVAGEQFAPAYQAINPNSRIPAIIDHDGPGGRPIALFESGAILNYLAEKSGMLVPSDPAARHDVLAWLFWQTSSQGPLLGQAAHFVSHARNRGIQLDYAVERYRNEAARLYDVLDRRLAGRAHICGDYSILWRLFDRRHRGLPLGAGCERAGYRHRALCPGEALVRHHRRAPGSGEASRPRRGDEDGREDDVL